MSKGAKAAIFSFAIFFTLFSCLLYFPPSLGAQSTERGNLVGHIYDRDGRTPVTGGVIHLKNISSGAMYESVPTDNLGAFGIEGLSKGIYTFGITTPLGDFNTNELIGIMADETTRIAISLNPFESGVQSAVQEVLREQAASPEGEVRIGRVVSYDSSTRRADVFVERGILQIKDRVQVRGVNTNFYQDVESLHLGADPVRKVLAGQNTWMLVPRPAETGDAVYAVCNKGVVPFFLTPCGIAWVIAGSGAILTGIVTITDKTPVSPIK